MKFSFLQFLRVALLCAGAACLLVSLACGLPGVGVFSSEASEHAAGEAFEYEARLTPSPFPAPRLRAHPVAAQPLHAAFVHIAAPLLPPPESA